jgi:hypothetical protein
LEGEKPLEGGKVSRFSFSYGAAVMAQSFLQKVTNKDDNNF